MTGNGNGRLGEAEYAELVARVHATVAAAVPPGASVLVVSKGDVALLEAPGVTAAHFPQDGAGGYAGHHPLDSTAAIAEAEELRRRGAEYLVIPNTARWWLDYYGEFAGHLATHGKLVADEPGACLIYSLGRLGEIAVEVPAIARPQASIDQMRDFLENLISTDASLVVLEASDGIAAELAPLNVMRVAGGEVSEESGDTLLAQLRRLAAEGAEYLVVPRSTDELLDRCAGLSGEIEASCRKIADQRHLCRVFELDGLREAPV